MRTRMMYLLLIGLCIGVFGPSTELAAGAQKGRPPVVRSMEITGEIAKMENGYIIRGKAPSEIFTILNPLPGTLDSLVRSGKTVRVKVKIVSGDNVEIESIDGKSYINGEKLKRTKEGTVPK